MQTAYRTHTCGQLRLNDIGKKVTLCGWIRRIRNLGPVIFIDLRDRYGITQLKIEEKNNKALFEQVRKLQREWVIKVEGTVVERESKNPNLPTGAIEVVLDSVEVLNVSELPPFLIEDETDGGQDLRMEYRYLDLRRPKMQRNLALRAKFYQVTRQYFESHGFLEVETPFLIRSTPEGARDFIVPSRLHPGQFFALPQSPQILKQILMIAGIDRYFQIVRCFRDEDFRGDRQPEFTQVDVEMAFVTKEDVLTLLDGYVRKVFQALLGVEIGEIPRYSYSFLMKRYGSDKPDLRFDLPITEVTAILGESPLNIFKKVAAAGGAVTALRVPSASNLSRKVLEQWTKFVQHHGAKGLAYIKLTSPEPTGTIVKPLKNTSVIEQLQTITQAQEGDLLLFIADEHAEKAFRFMGALRQEVAKTMQWIDDKQWKVFWVVDFPLFEWNEEESRLQSCHHPFTMPYEEDIPLLDSNPLKVRAQSYDLIINGHEIGGGSIRIHDLRLQQKIFQCLGMEQEAIQQQFGFFIKALAYGAPPHGGCAFGLDRWLMLLCNEPSIREVIAFPKNSHGRDPMMDAPSFVSKEQLQELHIQLQEDVS